MNRRILYLIICLASVIPAVGSSQWKVHTTFDGEIGYMADTPGYVYFTSKAMPDMNGESRLSLFRYDKEGEELQSLSSDNLLTFNTVTDIQYCPQKGYLVVASGNFDITFIYDDGKVVTMPDYRLSNISYPKKINSMTIDPWHDRVYVATPFGYIAVNDEKHEIAESRIYGEVDIKSVARVGEYIVLLKDTDRLVAKESSPRLSLSDYETTAYDSPCLAVPLSENKCIVMNSGGSPCNMMLLTDNGAGLESVKLDAGRYYCISNNKNGALISAWDKAIQVDSAGNVTTMPLPEDLKGPAIASYDLSEVWQGTQRKGIRCATPGASADGWTITRDYICPESPSPFSTPEMAVHPSKGLMVINYGFDYNFSNYPQGSPLLMSGYSDERWVNYSPVYTNADRGDIITSPNGMAIDPDNPDYVYVSSTHKGFIRLNLTDGTDLIHMSKPSDKDNGNPGFVALVEEPVSDNARWACNFRAPRLDSYGNLWMVHSDYDHVDMLTLYCWEAADRKATTMSNILLPKKVEYRVSEANNTSYMIPLRHESHKNMLVYSPCKYNPEIVLIDTKGTPADNSDDEVRTITNLQDQDGNKVVANNISRLWEDPNTGNVWVCSRSGVFYFKPDDYMGGSEGNVTRPKVARNDGTNLADYLLADAIVYNITADGRGNKWFSTGGGGLVCTGSDGREILEEINIDNSHLPSDVVYSALYVPEHNSLMISTSEGIVEYYLPGAPSSSGEEDLKIYPNPVRPDYFGYVTIEGVRDMSLVKIVDASGNIVKEFGPVSGDVKWDVTNHQFRRVSSGVYYVLASSGENESAFSTVGKILVVN